MKKARPGSKKVCRVSGGFLGVVLGCFQKVGFFFGGFPIVSFFLSAPRGRFFKFSLSSKLIKVQGK